MKKKILLFSILAFHCSFCMLNAQIKVYPNGTIHIGNTAASLLEPLNTNFEVNMQKTVIRCTTQLGVKGFQFIPSGDWISIASLPGAGIIRPVIALTGLADGEASIGTVGNNINVIYSRYYYSNGNYIGTLVSSDVNLKTNIRDLSSESERGLKLPSVSERVLNLRPVTYDFLKTSTGEDVSKNSTYKNRTGFIAQEVEKLFPDLVAIGENGLYSLDYSGLIPYLTKTIQDQNERIKKLEQQVGLLTTDFTVDKKENSFQKMSPVNDLATEENVLFQNAPNPFNIYTSIKYRLTDNAKDAKICIYNLNGKQLQCHNLLTMQGENSIEVQASSLQAGMYLYSLIVGNKLIDTKRMVLTE